MGENLELALRVRADMQQAIKSLNELEAELVGQGEAAKGAADTQQKLSTEIDKVTPAIDKEKSGLEQLDQELIDHREVVKDATQAQDTLGREINQVTPAAKTQANGLRALEKELNDQRTSAKGAADAHDRLGKAINRVTPAVTKQTGGMGGLAASFRGAVTAAAAYAVMQKAVDLVRLADDAKQLEARVKLATAAQGDFNAVWRELGTLATNNGARLGDTVDLFTGINRAAPELSATRDQVLTVTSAVQQLGAISGASGAQMSNSMLQFSQAMAGGIMRAEEMNSIIENTPAIAEAIAKGMDTTVGKLRLAVVEGKVLSKSVFDALLKQAPEIAQQFTNIPVSIDRAANSLATSMQRLILKLDEAAGITKIISDSIQGWAWLFGKAADLIEDAGKSEIRLLQLQQLRLEILKQERVVRLNIQNEEARGVDSESAAQRRREDELDALRAYRAQVEQELHKLNAEALKSGKEFNDALNGTKPTGVPKTLAEAIKAQTKANSEIERLVDRRQALLDSLDQLTQRMAGPADPAEQSSATNIFTVNRLRDAASDKTDAGDVSGALVDLERARAILSHLADEGAISPGYLKAQVDQMRELADKAANVEVKVPVTLAGDEDAQVRMQQWAKLKAEFDEQQKSFPAVAVRLDQDGWLSEAKAARQRLEEVVAQALRVPVQITPQLAGAGGQVPIVIPTGAGDLRGTLDGNEQDVVAALARDADARGSR